MSTSGPFDPTHAQEWIDQQRERWRAQFEGAGAGGSETWIKSMREWLKLLSPHASPLFGIDNADELSQTLRGFGAAQQGMLDALGKLPLFGLAATQFEPWRRLHAADAEFRKVEEQFRQAVIELHVAALDELERKLESGQGAAPSERELYDMWVECGEAVFAKTARTAEFAQLQGSVSNAAVRRLREQQKLLEQLARMFDLPTRTELNSVHQQLRTLRREIESLQAPAVQEPRSSRSRTAKRATRSPSSAKSLSKKERKTSR
jgi:class III poly(R)-hydroxyalkanoic acid synthase PhaE subunit